MTTDEQTAPLGVAPETGVVRFERRLPGPVERLWAYLADDDKRGRWLASGAMEPRVGAEFELTFRHAGLSSRQAPPPERYAQMDRDGHVSRHRVTRFEPPRVLAFTWGGGPAGGDSEVTFELIPEGEMVRLVLTHRRLADEETMSGVAGGWHVHLSVLEDRVKGREPPAFWDLFRASSGLYEKGLAPN